MRTLTTSAPSRALTAQSAYVHFPFCRRRCHYCDFPVIPVGDRPHAADGPASSYTNLLLRELACLPDPSPSSPPLSSLYFGGGTPSLTPPPLLAQTIESIRAKFGLADDAETTLEMDPGTFDAARLREFVDAGVTRVSVGVQSFDDELLRASGRAHGVAEVEEALGLLLDEAASPASPLRSVSLDLIGGLPQQTMASWRSSLRRAAASGAHHVSVYDLQIEPRTAFGRWFDAGTLTALPSEEDAADMFREAAATLGAAGFEHYEVSSYGRPGHRSRHNGAYWRNEPFHALGLGATSHADGRRLARPRKLKEYEAYVDELEQSGWAAAQAARGELEEGADALTTYIMLQLRTADGLRFGDGLAAAHGEELAAAAAAACEDAARELSDEWVELDDGRMRLRDPEGLLFSNEAIATVFARLDERLEK